MALLSESFDDSSLCGSPGPEAATMNFDTPDTMLNFDLNNFAPDLLEPPSFRSQPFDYNLINQNVAQMTATTDGPSGHPLPLLGPPPSAYFATMASLAAGQAFMNSMQLGISPMQNPMVGLPPSLPPMMIQNTTTAQPLSQTQTDDAETTSLIDVKEEYNDEDHAYIVDTPSPTSTVARRRSSSLASQSRPGNNKRPAKDYPHHNGYMASVGMVEHAHNMKLYLDTLPLPLQRELETFKKAIKKATMGDRLEFLHRHRKDFGRYAPFVAYETVGGAKKKIKLDTRNFFCLRGGFNEEAKTDSAQQAINKLNSLKMFFDQFPSMLIQNNAATNPALKKLKRFDNGDDVYVSKLSDQITQQPLQELAFEISNYEFQQFFPRWNLLDNPLEPPQEIQLPKTKPATVNREPKDQRAKVEKQTQQPKGLKELRALNPYGIVCLPRRPNRPHPATFQCRSQVFATLESALQAGAGAVVLLAGMAGVGKTQLVVRYLWKQFERGRTGDAPHKVTLWLDASTLKGRDDTLRAVAALAGESYLGLDTGALTNPNDIVDHVLYPWLWANRGTWLLVVDGLAVGGAEHVWELLQPVTSSGAIVATTRWCDVTFVGRDSETRIKLEPVSVDSAVEFLVTRTNLNEADSKRHNEHIRKVAARMGCLPTALESVGMQLCGSIQTFEEYYSGMEHMNYLRQVMMDVPTNAPTSLLSIYSQIRASIPPGPSQELLSILAFLPATHIPVAIFTGFEDAMHDFPKQVAPTYPTSSLFKMLEGSRQAIHKILQPLLDVSAVTRGEETGIVCMHTLVQEILHELMTPEERSQYRTSAVELLYAALCVERAGKDGSPIKPDDAKLGVDRLIPHVWAVLSNAAGSSGLGAAYVGLWCKFGQYVNYMCQYTMGGQGAHADFTGAHELAAQRGCLSVFRDALVAWVRFKRARRVNACQGIDQAEAKIKAGLPAPTPSHATSTILPYHPGPMDPPPLQFSAMGIHSLAPKPLDQGIVSELYSVVEMEPLDNPRLIAYSDSALALVGLGSPTSAGMGSYGLYFGGNQLFVGSQPTAQCYCGHQFGNFAGQLGDGRAHSLGEVICPVMGSMDPPFSTHGSTVELQLKGSGRTPYSRTADGRAVLRSSIREFLCSEYMAALGIPTVRAATLVVGDTLVTRDPMYVGRPIKETAAVISRIAPSFWRFGTFEVTSVGANGVEGPFAGDVTKARYLLDYYVQKHFPAIWSRDTDPANRHAAFFAEVVALTGRLVAHWQAVGFVHGVLNTDNMSVLGLTIDYGPFGFMDAYNPHFVPNYSDTDERYSYENQPKMCHWNLESLAEALSLVVPMELLHEGLAKYWATYEEHYESLMMAKLGLSTRLEGDRLLLDSLLDTMRTTGGDYTNIFRALSRMVAHTNPSVAAKSAEGLLEYILSQLDDGRELQAAMPYEADYLRVLAEFPANQAEVLHALTGKSRDYFTQRLATVERAKTLAAGSPYRKEEEDRQKWCTWLRWYQDRVLADARHYAGDRPVKTAFEEYNRQRVAQMLRINPKFSLRNYMAQAAFEKANEGDYSVLHTLLRVLTRPFDEHEDLAHLHYDRKAASLRMCVSCSS